jgi:hypothetical protein
LTIKIDFSSNLSRNIVLGRNPNNSNWTNAMLLKSYGWFALLGMVVYKKYKIRFVQFVFATTVYPS